MNIGKLGIHFTPDIITLGISFGLPNPENEECYMHLLCFLISWGEG